MQPRVAAAQARVVVQPTVAAQARVAALAAAAARPSVVAVQPTMAAAQARVLFLTDGVGAYLKVKMWALGGGAATAGQHEVQAKAGFHAAATAG